MFPLRMAPVIPLKYPKSEKNEFFDPPFFYERKVMLGHLMVFLIALDELYNLSLFGPIWLDLNGCKNKKTRFLTP
jgi:hypothetical protein